MPVAKKNLIAIVGPNSAGKTSLSLKLAKKFEGEIISADSRQVYRGMDIGTGKATKAERKIIPHYCIDVASPKKEYNVSNFTKDANNALEKIYGKNKIPFIVGGTGFWVQTVADSINIPHVEPDKKLRHRLSRKSNQELYLQLKKIDPRRAGEIDPQNPYRLIRALEIVLKTGRPVPAKDTKSSYRLLMLGIKHPQKKLYQLIDRRLDARMRQGMVAEAKRLHSQGISWKRMEQLGLEYRYLSRYLTNQLTKEEMLEQLSMAIKHFAKRQLTWFNKDKRIRWIKNYRQAEKLIIKHIS